METYLSIKAKMGTKITIILIAEDLEDVHNLNRNRGTYNNKQQHNNIKVWIMVCGRDKPSRLEAT